MSIVYLNDEGKQAGSKKKTLGMDRLRGKKPIEVPQIVASRFLEPPSNDDYKLKAWVWQLLESVARKLRNTQRMAYQMNCFANYVDHRQAKVKIKLREATQSERKFFNALESQWEKFLSRRLKVKSLEIQLSNLSPQFFQLDFTKKDHEASLLKTLDQIRQKYGDHSIHFARI